MAIRIPHEYTIDINQGVTRVRINIPFMHGDSQTHRFVFTINDGNDAAVLTGYVATLYAVRLADKITVPNEGTIDGNVVTIDNVQSDFLTRGRVDLLLMLSAVGEQVTLFWGEAMCSGGITETIADPSETIPTLGELFAQIAACESATTDAVAATGAANTAASSVGAAIAPAYSASNTYALDAICTYQGARYKCTTAITVAEAWTVGHWTAEPVQDALDAHTAQLAENANQLAALVSSYPYENLTPSEIINITDSLAMPVASIVSAGATDTIRVTGSNMFDGVLEEGTISIDGNPAAQASRRRSKNFTRVMPSTTYYYTTGSGVRAGNFQFYSASKAFISSSSVFTGTFTTPANCQYIKFFHDYTTFPTLDTTVMISKNSGVYEAFSATDYAYPGEIPMLKTGVCNIISMGCNAITVSRVNDTMVSQSDFDALESRVVGTSARCKKYYATLTNPSGLDYVDYPVQIRVKFAQGECISTDCIKVTDLDGVAIPHQWEDDYDEFNYAKNISYYGDTSVRCGTLWIIDSIDADETKNYIAWVYDTPITTGYTPSITTELNGTQYRFKIGSDYLYFQTDSMYRMKGYSIGGVGKDLDDKSSIKNDSVAYSIDAGGATLVSHAVRGDGVVFLEMERVINWNDLVRITTRYKLYNNWHIDVKSWFEITTETSTIEYLKTTIAPTITTGAAITTAIEALSGSPYTFTVGVAWSDGVRNASAFTKYVTGIYYRDLGTGEYNNGTIYEGSAIQLVMIQDPSIPTLSVGRVLASAISIVLTSAGENEYIKQFNDLISYATKDTAESIKARIKEKAKTYVKHISRYCLASIASGGGAGGGDRRHMDIMCYYALYKYAGVYTLDYVKTQFLSWQNSLYGGTTAAGMRANWEAGVGIEYIGTFTHVAYWLYRDYLALGDTTTAGTLSDLLVQNALFYAGVYATYSDIPLNNTLTVGNTNARTFGLYGLVLGKLFSSDASIQTAIDGILALCVEGKMLWGRTCLQEGKPSGLQYAHYQCLSSKYFNSASKLDSLTVAGFTSPYEDMLKTIHPSGQFRDLTLTSDDSRRRGCYAYLITALALTDNLSALSAAEAAIDHLSEITIPIAGRYVEMSVDSIPTYNTFWIEEVEGLLWVTETLN